MISDEYIANLPDGPGVYLFKDEAKDILYVGKARSIRERVRSYFREGPRDGKTEKLLRHVDDVAIETAKRRAEELAQGKIRGIPAEEVMRRARERLQ